MRPGRSSRLLGQQQGALVKTIVNYRVPDEILHSERFREYLFSRPYTLGRNLAPPRHLRLIVLRIPEMHPAAQRAMAADQIRQARWMLQKLKQEWEKANDS